MAIARDTHGFSAGAVDTGKTLSLTLASGSVLFAVISYSDGTSSITCSWNGTAMTQIDQQNTGGVFNTLFFLGNPASGTHNLVTSMTSCYNDLFAASYTGASTNTPTVFAHNQNAAASTISITLDNSNSAWYFGGGNGGPGLTSGTNATSLDSDGGYQGSFDSNGVASSNTMTINRTGSGTIQLIGAAFTIPVASTSSPSFFLGLMGVGT